MYIEFSFLFDKKTGKVFVRAEKFCALCSL